MLSEGRVRRIHTHTLYSSSFHGRLSPHVSFCDPHPTVFLSFSFCLWIQTGFEAKVAFDPSRFVNLPTNLPASTSNFTITYTQKIYTDIPLELPKDDQVLLLQGFNDVLYLKRNDGKRFSSATENLKNNSSDQKSRCRTCAKACYSPLKQRERRRERHKFAYQVGKNNSFARLARAFFTFVHFFVFSQTTTCNSQV